ncbi:MAG: hypothetical protein ABIN58_13795, partial [candidate division WOR-3 bacterium]
MALEIIPLGGCGEIGKNLNVVRYNRQILVVDAGLSFPTEDLYGVDLVIESLTKNICGFGTDMGADIPTTGAAQLFSGTDEDVMVFGVDADQAIERADLAHGPQQAVVVQP